MPELRQNPFTKQWVIISTERARRPQELIRKSDDSKPLPTYSETCPFCPRNEHLAPPEIFRLPKEGPWQVRIVPNRFAALARDGEPTRHLDGLKCTVNGVGVHDVIVETPDHSKTTALLSDSQVSLVIEAYRQRYFEILKDQRIEHVTIFKNHGIAAGTSLEHPHSQLIATPIIPPDIVHRLGEALRYYDVSGQCIFCKTLMDELADRSRLITETEHFVSFIPFAALTPFSIWIFPRRHMASFADINADEQTDMARILRTVLAKLYFGLGNPDFNYIIRTAPVQSPTLRYYHWYLTIVPRLTKSAGFELGSGMYINPTIPEGNAEFLRGITAPSDSAAPK